MMLSHRSSVASSNLYPSSGGAALCIQCGSRPQLFEPSSGTQHPFCSKSCARDNVTSNFQNISRSNSSTQAGSPLHMCEHCLTRAKFQEGGRVHDYCGRCCAAQATGSKPQVAAKKCKIPSCHLTPVKGQGHDEFCSVAHSTLFQRICLFCGRKEKQPSFPWCSRTCGAAAEARGPCILRVHPDHETFKEVKAQFDAAWRHPSKRPSVKSICKVVNHKSSIGTYNTYKDGVELRGQFVRAGRSKGNEQRRFHGTHRACSLGDKKTTFCSEDSCSLCGILKTSFKLSASGSRFPYGRFGKGIYTSATSSKSNDYASNSSNTSTTRALILAKVVVGTGFKATVDMPNLASPPPGYDSVLGEVSPTGTLNYDELIVYDEAAVSPSWLIVYGW